MSTTTNLGITKLDSGLRQPEVVINNAFDAFDAAIGSFTTGVYYNALDHGLTGDGVTDDTAALQALIDLINTTGKDATVFFPAGTYLIGGALQDTSLSNAQIVLPKRNSPLSMLSIRLLGATPPAQAWDSSSGSVLLSTLTSGTGQMIGVKNNISGLTVPPASALHQTVSWISLVMENLTIRMHANPTNSALDLTHVPHVELRNLRIDTTSNTINLIGGGSPDYNISNPTTSTSYGIKGNEQIVNVAIYDNIEVIGYYNGIRWSELASADNITIAGSINGVEFMAGIHRNDIKRLLIVNTQHCIKVTGANVTFIHELDIEHDAQPLTLDDVSDASNLMYGQINWFSEVPISTGTYNGEVFGINGAANVFFRRLNKSWNNRSPSTTTVAGGASLETGDHAIDETYRGLATSDDTKVAWKLLTAKQSGTANIIGVLAALNAAVSSGDRRVGEIVFRTDGATNSGGIDFYTSNAGTLTRAALIDKYANFSVVQLLPRGEGGTLASAATIAPDRGIHVVSGTAAISTITVPSLPGGGGVTVALLPIGAWTYTNSGNIAGAGGTAVVGRTMFATWSAAQAKWFMSY